MAVRGLLCSNESVPAVMLVRVQVAMSMTLTISSDGASISAVGKDSLGSYCADGAITMADDVDRSTGMPVTILKITIDVFTINAVNMQ